MKVKVYVNWEDQKVMSEKEFDEMLADKIKNKRDDNYELDNYLEWEHPYTHAELFFLTEADKKELYKKFEKYCKEQVEEEILINGEWFEKIVEI